jgi:CRP/FNR family transcriptional regulator, cyclic AMP receptor protein
MTTADIYDLLRHHPFFKDLEESAVEFIAGCGMNVRFAAGEYIFREGEPANTFYVVRAGNVGLEIASPDRGSLMIETVGEDEILGVSWLFPPYRWQFDARALELTRAISLDATCLRAKCDEDPGLGYALMQRVAETMSRRLQSARIRLLDLYSHAGAG